MTDALLGRILEVVIDIRQSVRMQRVGEITALHEKLDAAVARIDELAAEIEKLKVR